MEAVKESLRNTIELLSDEEARKILEFAQRLRQKNNAALTLKRLAGIPTFRVPAEGLGVFRTVKPIRGRGIPASQLLAEDRR